MSLEKFQATDAWRNKFKNLLFTKRKPCPSVAPGASLVQTPQRLSFELSEDLQVILEEKKIPRGERKMPRVRDVEENKENCEEHQQDWLHSNTPTKLKHFHKVDTTLVDESNDALQVTNTSFETLEEMCEKTASDPDSTLFRYLHRESASMLQTTRAEKVHSYDEEADALQRLLDELNVEETEKRFRQNSPCNDTQLDDIEAPSRFWENTLTAETLQSISPVKMVGLLRQSTIMEECSASEAEESSTSYQSALKSGWSSETTGCYETASETATASEQGGDKKMSINSSGASSTSSDLFQQRHSRRKFFDNEEEEVTDKSLHLIEFEKTVVDPLIPDSPQSPESSTDQTEDSLEPLKSSPESSRLTSIEDSLEPLKSSPELTQLTESDGSSSIIELSDDESAAGCDKILEKIEKLEEEESVLNRSFTIHSETVPEEKSLHFNDTMEEVEYMMKKGMQYIEAAKEGPSPAKSHLTPVKKAERYRSPSPMLSSPVTPKTVIAKPKPVNKFALDIKPFPKLELFKKPTASNLRPPVIHNKFVSSVKKQQYSHVISPIGAYINKTSTTPLVSTIKPGCGSPSTSKAFKQLDYDSRVTPQDAAAPSDEPPQKNHTCSLPKKAYISSEFKHITDERTQVTIPGGPKIQRYLLNSMIPAIVRHEGKVKIPANMRTSDMEPPAPRRTDDSLANLSMISGDVSVYTIKDANKF